MTEPTVDAEAINRALASWRQGDVVLGDRLAYAHVMLPAQPLTPAAAEAAGDVSADGRDDPTAVWSTTPGLVVLTQTCDIVRDCLVRPYLELAPLVEVDAKALNEIRRLMRPQYAYVPGVSERRLVADPDRTMTIEKAVIAAIERRARRCRGDHLRPGARPQARPLRLSRCLQRRAGAATGTPRQARRQEQR